MFDLSSRESTAPRSNLLALGVTVLWPVLAAGGFSAKSQIVFVVLAAGLGLVTLISAPDRSVKAFRNPIVITLLLLGTVSVASAAWSIGSCGTALRAGLVAVAFAVVMASSLIAAQDGAGRALAAGLALTAAGEALIGIVAAATHSSPDAELLAGVWRPGGTFEYQPALALLQVGALPIFAALIADRKAWLMAAGAAGSVLAGAAVALAGDRMSVALAVIVALVLVARAWREPRQLTAALIMALAAAAGAIVAVAVLERTVRPDAGAPGIIGFAPILAAAVIAAALAAIGSQSAGRLGTALGRAYGMRGTRGATGVLLLVGVMVVAAALLASADVTSAPHTAGFFHGRLEEWRAALQTWSKRPLLGSGAGTYYQASLPHQTVAVSRFAHDLPLEWAVELGIPGALLAIALYVTVGRSALRGRLARHTNAILFVPFVVVFMLSNLLDWTWHLAGLTALWAVALGALQAGGVSAREEIHTAREFAR